MKVKAVVNPHSANGKTRKRWPQIEQNLKEAFRNLDSEVTTGPWTAPGIVTRALHDGYDTIISVGGDGTLNEVVNGFFENGRLINERAVLGVVSTGTGSDFIKSISFPREIEKVKERFIRSKIKKCDAGVIHFRTDAGDVGTRYFINIADIGIGGETVERVNRTTKIFGGFISFLWGSIITGLSYKNKRVRIKIDDVDYGEKIVNSVVIANGRYFGGGMMIAPDARIDDGLFDIIIVGGISRSKFLRYGRLIYRGKHIYLPEVKCLRGRVLEAGSEERVLIDVDGEHPGILPVRSEIIPSAINILV